MKYPLLGLPLFAAICPTVHSQDLRPMPGPLRDAGTYHVASGTWTRKSQIASLGADVIYDNTCATGAFSALAGDTYVDEGRLPSSSSAQFPGCSVDFQVDGFRIAYCTDQDSSVWSLAFFQQYATCTSTVGVPPTASFSFSTLPGGSPAVTACWLVTIDLAGPSGSGAAFTMLADGDGSAGGGTSDRFGWSIAVSGLGTGTGPVVAGDPSTCPFGAGTPWNPGQPGPGTGIDTEDRFYINPPSTYAGCHFFGGLAYASFHLQLIADACQPPTASGPSCDGDGVAPHSPCPCGNGSAPGAHAGCLNSLGLGGKLRAVGTASVSNDSVTLLGSDMTNSAVLYFQGTLLLNGGNGMSFGDGLRCAGGAIRRLGTVQNVSGASQYPGPLAPGIALQGAINGAGTRSYQAWYRNIATFCTPAGFNLTNGIEFAWGA